jgi:predicted MFS family arabinose efflux permease
VEQSHSSLYVWYAICLLSVVNVFNYMDRMALSVLAPLVKASLKLSDSELGLLVGFAFALFYAICGIPIARWADRGVRRDIIALSLTIWSAMTALSGVVQNFWHLFLVRVGVGIGEAGCFPPGQSMLCDYVPIERRSGVLAIHSFGAFVGMTVGMALAGSLAEVIGWRWTFVALGLPGIVLAILVRLTLREPRRGSFDAVKDDEQRAPFLQTVVELWRCRTYRLLLVFLTMNGSLYFGMIQWWPSFYARVFGLSLSQAGIYLGTAIGVGSGLGLLIGGLLGNKLAQRDVRLPLMLGAASILLGLPTALGSLFIHSAAGSIFLVALSVLLWGAHGGPVLATLYSVARPRMRATAGALAIFFQSAVGFGIGPLCVGVLSDLLAPKLGVESLRYALLAPICLMPFIVITLYAAARVLPRDLRSAR